VRALAGVDLFVADGEMVAIMGPSGSGIGFFSGIAVAALGLLAVISGAAFGYFAMLPSDFRARLCRPPPAFTEL